eukprot:gene530-biopygen22629
MPEPTPAALVPGSSFTLGLVTNIIAPGGRGAEGRGQYDIYGHFADFDEVDDALAEQNADTIQNSRRL